VIFRLVAYRQMESRVCVKCASNYEYGHEHGNNERNVDINR
jgi:hypothetical protein